MGPSAAEVDVAQMNFNKTENPSKGVLDKTENFAGVQSSRE